MSTSQESSAIRDDSLFNNEICLIRVEWVEIKTWE